MDVREITGDLVGQTTTLADARPVLDGPVHMASDGSADTTIETVFTNPTSRPIEVEISPRSADSRWTFSPDHRHQVIAPGERATFAYRIRRVAGSFDDGYRDLELTLRADYLTEVRRYAMPEQVMPLPVIVDLEAPSRPISAARRRPRG